MKRQASSGQTTAAPFPGRMLGARCRRGCRWTPPGRNNGPGGSRGGVVTLELLLTLPIFLILLMGLIEISLLMFARGEIVEASRAGARLATLSGVDPWEVDEEVQRSLRGRFGTAVNVDAYVGEYSGDEVVVTVRVPMWAAAPDLLWPVGYSLQGQQIIAETRMVKE